MLKEVKDRMKAKEKRYSLAIASIVLGAISSMCCISTGIGIIPALISSAFGVIAIVSGSEKSRRAGVAGLVLGLIGLITNAVVLVWAIQSIDWNHFTVDQLLEFLNIDSKEIMEMMKEFEQLLENESSSIIQ